MHIQTVCKVLNKFQHGKYLVAYVLKDIHIETGVYIMKVKQPVLFIKMIVRLEMTQITTC